MTGSMAIQPERDPLPQPDAASRVAYLESTAPRIACRIIPGASHWVAFEAPDEVNRLVAGFVHRNAPAAQHQRLSVPPGA